MTEIELEKEMVLLKNDPDVKLAILEQRRKYKQRQRLYQLRWLKKRGEELRKAGITEQFIRTAEILYGVPEFDGEDE